MEDLKEKLVDRLIEHITRDIAHDTTVLDVMLHQCPVDVLIQSLPEEEWKEFEALTQAQPTKEQQAKATLEELGFYCGNLWSLEDVKAKFKCTDDEAYEVLDGALQNDATMEQIWFAIGMHGENDGLEAVENVNDLTHDILDKHIAEAGKILVADDLTIEEMVRAIREEAKIDGQTMIDNVEGVVVWEKREYTTTCQEFLEEIGYL